MSADSSPDCCRARRCALSRARFRRLASSAYSGRTPSTTKVTRRSTRAVITIIPASSAASGSNVSAMATTVSETRSVSALIRLISSPDGYRAVSRGGIRSRWERTAVRSRAVTRSAVTPSGRPPGTLPGTPVEICSASDGRTVEFPVADHGPGIPATDRDRIFRRFAQLDPRRTSGTGLGLCIVAAIAAAHCGQVRLTDTAGGGATFSIVVPLRRPARVPGTAVGAPGAGLAGQRESPAAWDEFRKALA